jgi:hypothetical protein
MYLGANLGDTVTGCAPVNEHGTIAAQGAGNRQKLWDPRRNNLTAFPYAATHQQFGSS